MLIEVKECFMYVITVSLDILRTLSYRFIGTINKKIAIHCVSIFFVAFKP